MSAGYRRALIAKDPRARRVDHIRVQSIVRGVEIEIFRTIHTRNRKKQKKNTRFVVKKKKN